MRSLESIIADAAESQRRLLEEAFEAGRAVGRQEAATDLRAKIDGVLSQGEPAPMATFVKPSIGNDKRAVSGSVRPTIERMIIDHASTGLTLDEIEKATGFKHNSIRGTLWTLGNQGIAHKFHGRWFPKASVENKTEAA